MTECAETETPARRWFLANKAVEANPGLPAGLVGRGAAFLAMGRPWEAVADLDKALRWATRGAQSPPNGDGAAAVEEAAKIKLLRGHAHSACLSYDDAAPDFLAAAKMLRHLEDVATCRGTRGARVHFREREGRESVPPLPA